MVPAWVIIFTPRSRLASAMGSWIWDFNAFLRLFFLFTHFTLLSIGSVRHTAHERSGVRVSVYFWVCCWPFLFFFLRTLCYIFRLRPLHVARLLTTLPICLSIDAHTRSVSISHHPPFPFLLCSSTCSATAGIIAILVRCRILYDMFCSLFPPIVSHPIPSPFTESSFHKLSFFLV
ncbi:hypothetical protein BKA93DRAFT_152024 [Sparassis latifolia]